MLGRRAPTPSELAQYVPVPSRMRVLRADGRRIDLTHRDAGRYLTAVRQGWSREAWSYRDLIGELRYALRLRARSVARCRFYVAAVLPHPDDPVPLDDERGATDSHLDRQLVADAVHNFNLLPLQDPSPDGFVARLDENLGCVGEAWVHRDIEEQFHIRSVSEVEASRDGRVTIALLPGGTASDQQVVDPNAEELLRCWVPHPEYGQLADAPMRSLLDVAEDVVLAGREQRAAARSRVAANGFLLVPNSMSLVPVRRDGGQDGTEEDTFMQDLTAAMLAPISDDGDPQAVVPIVLRGDTEEIKAVQHLSVERAESEQLIERQSAALLRLLRGLDIQPEQVEGIGSVNHWTSWQIDARAVRDQIIPAAETVAACLTAGYLRPALESLGHDPAVVKRIIIAVDSSPLSENPNRSQDARDAHDRLTISDEALREALGFSDQDAPDQEEWMRRLASSGKLPVADAAQLLGIKRDPITVQGDTTTPALPAGEDRPVAEPGQTSPNRPIPATPDQTPAITAAAADTDDDIGFELDIDASRALADIDAALLERIQVAADAAVARVLERAGARVRSQAQKNRSLAAQLRGVDAVNVPFTLGRAKVETFAPISELLADDYARLEQQVRRWLADAARQAADTTLTLLRLDPDSREGRTVHAAAISRLTARIDDAWRHLAQHLDKSAEDALFQSDPLAGEPRTGTLVPATVVREMLDIAGGDQ